MWKADNLNEYKESTIQTMAEAALINDYFESVVKVTANALAIGLSAAIAKDLESAVEEIKAGQISAHDIVQIYIRGMDSRRKASNEKPSRGFQDGSSDNRAEGYYSSDGV